MLNRFNLTSYSPSPHFQGVTHLLRGKRWIEPETLNTLMASSNTPYLGNLTPSALQFSKEDPKALFQGCDELSEILRLLEPQEIALEATLDIKGKQKTIPIQYLGRGNNGLVYNLNINGQPHIFKAYHIKDGAAWSEQNAGVFLSNKPIADLPRFYFGNPMAGWAGFELIDKTMFAKDRPGKRLADLPIILGDHLHSENFVNDIRVDYGGLENRNKKNLQHYAYSQKFTPSQYQKAMASNDLLAQLHAASSLNKLPGGFLEEAYTLALETHHPLVHFHALSRLSIGLVSEAFQETVYKAAMASNDPTIQTLAATRIPNLHRGFKEEAYLMTMATGNPKVQAAAILELASLSYDFREDAYQLAWKTGHPKVQANAALLMARLLDTQKIEQAYEVAMATGDPLIQKNAAGQFIHFRDSSDAFKIKAYKMAWATGNLSVQDEASKQIEYLPERFREEAYLQAMNTQNLLIQKNAIQQINDLRGFKGKAFQMALNTHHINLQLIAFSQFRGLTVEDQRRFFPICFEILKKHYPLKVIQKLEVSPS